MSADWKSLLATVAPALATALGGPLAGVATRAISAKLLDGRDLAATDLGKLVGGATPELLGKLREADQQFALDMQQIGVDLERIAATDRNSARTRETARGDSTPAKLAAVAVIGFFTVLTAMMLMPIPESAQQPVNILLGALTGLLLQVGNYYFGSSAGSARKNEMINAVIGKTNG